VGILVQFDLSQARERLLDPEDPNRWRGWRLIFGT